MSTKLKECISLRQYLIRLTKEIADKEQLYNEEIREINPERYIRNEYKITHK